MTVRAVLYEEDDARAVAARLRAGGFEASVARERFAGEDDDEDHPWTVLTDAPLFMVEVVVEEHDGWVEDAPAGHPARTRRAARPAGRATPRQGALPGALELAPWTNGCCSCTPTPTTRPSARAPPWRSTSRGAPRSPW